MNRTLLPTLAVVFLAGCATGGVSAERSVIRAKNRVAPALVHIRPVKEVFTRGKREEVLIIGSGFIISPDGYVVTNEHVAGKSRYVKCVLGNKDELDAAVVGTDPFTDIAVLKLQTDRKDLPFVKLGHSAGLETGQTVMAMGSPHGLARSVSQGIVSVTERYLENAGQSISPYNNWIQTDAAINPGNSGGPLVDIRGEVVGINTRKDGRADNIGFAIPIDIAREVIDEIIANGRVVRSTIGAEFQEMKSKTEDPSQQGVVIADIDPLSPAHEAGLRPGDILLAVNGTPTNARFEEDLPPIRKLIADAPVDSEIALTVQRGDQSTEVKVKTVERSQLEGDEVEFEKWGCSASNLTPEMVRRAQLASAKGIVVTGTQEGGAAANAKLQAGDIVLKIDDVEIKDMQVFTERYDALAASHQHLVLFTVKRGALTQFVMLKQEAETAPEGETARDK